MLTKLRKSELDKGIKIKEINISMKLSILKPLHAKWLIDLYNYITIARWSSSVP